MKKYYFTSESVTEGHPDKLCDYISDSILDAYLEKDELARVACETVAGKGQILVTGEITSNAEVDIEKIVKITPRTAKNIPINSKETLFELYGKLSKIYLLKKEERVIDNTKDKIVVANSSTDKKL